MTVRWGRPGLAALIAGAPDPGGCDMRVRFGTPSAAAVPAAALLNCLLVLLTGCAGPGQVSRDGTAFARGRAAISWGGNWMYGGYHQAFGDDLKVVPLPRFGTRPSSGLGSWQWGITTVDGDTAWRFLAYLLEVRQVLRLARANGAIPATRAAISQAPAFAAGGPEHLYVQQLEDGIARARPQTPAYPAITAAFSAAFLDITGGGSVRPALDTAVGQIDRNLAAHRYYQPSEP